MQTKFKRHQKVKLLLNPLERDIEPYQDEEPAAITKGMTGEINIVLPNGQYHILIRNAKGDKLAYIVMDEENLQEIGTPQQNHIDDEDDVDEELVDMHHKNKSNN